MCELYVGMDWTSRGWAEISNNKNQLGSKASQQLSRTGSWTHWHAQNPALEEVLMEEPGQLLWQDTDPMGKCKKHECSQSSPEQATRSFPLVYIRHGLGADQANQLTSSLANPSTRTE